MSTEQVRVILVAENACLYGAGEMARPLQYFLRLHRRGIDIHLVVHERNRVSLESVVPELSDRIHYVRDSWLQRLLWRVGKILPDRIQMVGVNFVSNLLTQRRQRRLIREILDKNGATIVHQPTPISPKLPSLMYGLGVPVVVGPLNGDMDYPPAFRRRDVPLTGTLFWIGRRLAHLFNHLLPGKLDAAVILFSNQRTRAALPAGCKGKIIELVANAVDTQVWSPNGPKYNNGEIRFVYLGRLVDFKAIDLLLEAFRRVIDAIPARLEIIGDGRERASLERRCRDLGIEKETSFSGWLRTEECARRMNRSDVFVFPSLREAGGAAVMEAMSLGLPVVAADWGGPADYVGPDAGLLVEPGSRNAFVDGVAQAMLKLARSSELRHSMGKAAHARALAGFDWELRIDSLLETYSVALNGGGGRRVPFLPKGRTPLTASWRPSSQLFPTAVNLREPEYP